MRLFTQDALVMAVDIQERLMPAIYKADKMIARSAILLQGMQALGVPVVVTRQYPKGLGDTVPEIIAVTQDVQPLDKITFSCYDDAAIQEAITATGKRTIILCGAEAHICLLQTAIDLQSAGYQAVIVQDAVSSRNKSDKKVALRRATQEGIIVTTTESILFELCRAAGTDAFKTISRLIK